MLGFKKYEKKVWGGVHRTGDVTIYTSIPMKPVRSSHVDDMDVNMHYFLISLAEGSKTVFKLDGSRASVREAILQCFVMI